MKVGKLLMGIASCRKGWGEVPLVFLSNTYNQDLVIIYKCDFNKEHILTHTCPSMRSKLMWQ